MKNLNIIIAEDDADDRLLIQRAFKEAGIKTELKFLFNGEELVNYLKGNKDQLSNSLLFMDLNMPMKSGLEALKEIKKEKGLEDLPIVILTTSRSSMDVKKTHELGGTCFISKPSTYKELVIIFKNITAFWIKNKALPQNGIF